MIFSSSKSLLKKSLGNLIANLEILQIWGHLTYNKSLRELLISAGFTNTKEITNHVKNSLARGDELLFVIGRIDDYSHSEKIKILKLFIKLNSLNPRRVHIIFNSFDKPWFLDALHHHKELMTLANRMEIVPVLTGKLLIKYIKQRSQELGSAVSEQEVGSASTHLWWHPTTSKRISENQT